MHSACPFVAKEIEKNYVTLNNKLEARNLVDSLELCHQKEQWGSSMVC